ncbi:MAG: pseudouridine synthase [Candidatus Kapabacteria bacterium]|nr:pseudouridine synthase [Candidatus Kapabacteria bacterium]
MIIAFYKPYGVLSQFTGDGSPNKTLAEFGFPKEVYPVGRLDADSEGLLLLSDESDSVKFLLEPRYAHPREYWVQVEGNVDTSALQRLESGILIREYRTKPAKASVLTDDAVNVLPPRVPPIRVRQTIPTSWISLELTEGKNRQVRRMTAAVGLPTLRLVRVRIGNFRLPFVEAGKWRVLSTKERKQVLMR